jgi:hypothetical protein
MSCYDTLKEKEDLRGYTMETLLALEEESLPPDECEKLLNEKEIIYG